MNYALSYWGRSEVLVEEASAALRFSPNLARDRVAFDATVLDPIRFREGMSALHEVVVGDLRFKERDKSAHEGWKREELARERALRQRVFEEARADALDKLGQEAPPPGLEEDFRRMHRRYWTVRVKWANELMRDDPQLFRHLVPCDPVVTVAPDVVFFECFAKDESSYGCLYADRSAFEAVGPVSPGTTNVDYSVALFDHFQSLRSYRRTKLVVDPGGFDVQVAGRGNHHEEKIDLPSTWLRGFGQIAAASGLPARVVTLPVETVYSILAHLERHREKSGPRSIRFQLEPGRTPRVVLDPWDVTLEARGAPYRGTQAEEIKVWGRRRLMVLARTLPFADQIEVRLLGSGLPSIWTVSMGSMRFQLALSGWTTNDWSSGAVLDQLAGHFRVDRRAMGDVSDHLARERRGSLAQLGALTGTPPDALVGALHRLAKQGQVIYDFGGDCYRWRSIMPAPLTDSLLGPEPPELEAGRDLAARTIVAREEPLTAGRVLVTGKADKTSCEAILDADNRYRRAKCSCKFFRKNRLRGGPCRHLIALRLAYLEPTAPGGSARHY